MGSNSFNFTKAALVALPLPETGARSTYLDTKKAGLQLRVTAAGIKTFSFYRRIKAWATGARHARPLPRNNGRSGEKAHG